MKRRKVIILFIMLVVLGPLSLFLFINVGLSLGENNINIKEPISNYLNGMSYTSKSKFYDMLQEFSVYNYHETLPIYEKDDRIYEVHFDDSTLVRKKADIKGKNGKFEYIWDSFSGLSLEYKENYLTKTVYYFLSDVEFGDKLNNHHEQSVKTDFDSFMNYTLIRGYIDFSNAKITKTKIVADGRYILVEGVLGSELLLGISCLNKYIKIDNPTFSFQASYYDIFTKNEINPYECKDIKICFQSNSKYELDSNLMIEIYRK